MQVHFKYVPPRFEESRELTAPFFRIRSRAALLQKDSEFADEASSNHRRGGLQLGEQEREAPVYNLLSGILLSNDSGHHDVGKLQKYSTRGLAKNARL